MTDDRKLMTRDERRMKNDHCRPQGETMTGPSLLDPELIARFGQKTLPRYTSYPPANLWTEQNETLAVAALASVSQRPLSLYVHIPFCHKLCLYCGCNMLVTRKQDLVARYLDALFAEVALVASRCTARPPVLQVHLGGGTPTYLSAPQLRQVWQALDRHFALHKKIEASIEVHPPVTSAEQLECLAELGFSRISMGVQDFDETVQKRVHRIQPFAQTRDLIVRARALGFHSVNLDLMYGLPLQTVERFSHTLDRVAELLPDRIALFGYAHMPTLRKHQAVFKKDELPTVQDRAALLELGVTRLLKLGYVYVGLDHFALPGDELLSARQAGELRRNFMGYTTGKTSDVLAFGSSAISEIGPYYYQNARDVIPYCEAVEQKTLPVVRGYSLNADEQIRREVVMEILCNLKIDFARLSEKHGIDFKKHFAKEIGALAELADAGLCQMGTEGVCVLDKGQLLLRVVAATFDATQAPHAATGL